MSRHLPGGEDGLRQLQGLKQLEKRYRGNLVCWGNGFGVRWKEDEKISHQVLGALLVPRGVGPSSICCQETTGGFETEM